MLERDHRGELRQKDAELQQLFHAFGEGPDPAAELPQPPTIGRRRSISLICSLDIRHSDWISTAPGKQLGPWKPSSTIYSPTRQQLAWSLRVWSGGRRGATVHQSDPAIEGSLADSQMLIRDMQTAETKLYLFEPLGLVVGLRRLRV